MSRFSRKISYFKLGLFIIVCGAVGLIALIWLGLSHYFEETETYLTYFDESVKGLQKDALVNYLGVPVGRVQSIGIGPDGRHIEVVMGLQPEFKVDQSMAIRLRDQGLTGLRYLEIGKAPPNLQEVTPKVDFPLEHPLIPSVPSELEQIMAAFASIYSKLIAVDIEGLTDNWKHTAEIINSILVEGKLTQSLQNFHSSTQQLEQVAAGINKAINPKEVDVLLTSLRKTAEQASTFMTQLAQFSTRPDMKGGLKDLSATLAATRKTSETLAAQVEALPPDTLSRLAKQLDQTFETGQQSVTRLGDQAEDSLTLFQQNLHQLNLLLSQLTSLVQNVKEQPGRLLFRGNEPDPFRGKN